MIATTSRLPLVCLLAAGLAACDDDTSGDRQQRMHVGAVAGTDVVLAISTGETMTAYVCGGDATFGTHTRWFHDADIDEDGRFEISADGWTLAGTLENDAVSGTLSDPMGIGHDLFTPAVSGDDLPGLFTHDIDGCTTGVVVFDAGGTVDAQGTWCNTQAEFRQVIILEPLDLTAEGIAVQVDAPDGLREFFVTRWSPPA